MNPGQRYCTLSLIRILELLHRSSSPNVRTPFFLDMSQSIQPSLALDRSTGHLRRHTTSVQWCSSWRNAVFRCSASRRAVLFSNAFVSWRLTEATSAAYAAKLLKGFTVVQDKADGYQYLAPFGWQEVDVEGVDSLYKVEIHLQTQSLL